MLASYIDIIMLHIEASYPLEVKQIDVNTDINTDIQAIDSPECRTQQCSYCKSNVRAIEKEMDGTYNTLYITTYTV